MHLDLTPEMGFFPTVNLRVFVPPHNEDEYLTKLLECLIECLRSQTPDDFEIMVADADSSDRTVEIAREYGARVVPGGMPAVGRNTGADVATCKTTPLSDVRLETMTHGLANLHVRLNQYTNPMAPGYCILIHSRLFHRVDESDEAVKHAEEFDLEFGDFQESNKNSRVRRLESGISRVARNYNRMGTKPGRGQPGR